MFLARRQFENDYILLGLFPRESAERMHGCSSSIDEFTSTNNVELTPVSAGLDLNAPTFRQMQAIAKDEENDDWFDIKLSSCSELIFEALVREDTPWYSLTEAYEKDLGETQMREIQEWINPCSIGLNVIHNV